MSAGGDSEGEGEEQKKFFAELAKTGRATCKKCKQKIDSGTLRLAKAAPNPFGSGIMKQWHHVECLFEVFKKQRATTARINTPDDMAGWDNLGESDRAEILKFLPDLDPDNYKGPVKEKPVGTSKQPSKQPKGKKGKEKDAMEKGGPSSGTPTKTSSTISTGLAAVLPKSVPGHKDNSFREFRRLCVQISSESSYTGKTALVKQLFEKGTGGDGFKGDIRLWIKLLLPGAVKRVYNLQSKQLVKLFSRIFHEDQDEMLGDLEKGDVAETITRFFQESQQCHPVKNSHLTLQEVDQFLAELSQLTREDDQAHLFSQICTRCTANDLTFIIRLIKHDLRINAGPKHILEAIHPEAYLAFQTSRDLDTVLEEVFTPNKKEEMGSPKKNLNITVKLMTPVLPMLAEACKSIEQALKKCPNGMFSEIKYDGERVQVHKSGNEFKYFSRSLKPVMPHKVKEFKDYIPQAFPGGEDLILDSEILMIDTKTSQPLPFGTLGIHKKGEYKDACVCLFVFDCIYYNGESLLHLPMRKRRNILHEHMTEIPNRIVFSEMLEVHNAKDLEKMMTKVFQMGLEGLVLKDLESSYEPGKRHWLKVKKDYLFGGAMADSADLVVLGAWFGTGQKGGMMSVFLMGCWDPDRKYWCTVTKVHTGHDDKTLERLQGELQMEKISKEISRVPSWLKCTKTMVPDFVAKNPKEMPVWEITGAEFTQHEVHTAAGISIRFPRVTRIRSDKTWETATSLPELKDLFKKSKDNTDFCLPAHFTSDNVCPETESPKKQRKIKIKDEESPKQDLEKGSSNKIDTERESSPNTKSLRDYFSAKKVGREHSPEAENSEDCSPKLKIKRGKDDSPRRPPSRGHSPKWKYGSDDAQSHKAIKDEPLSRKNSVSPKPRNKPIHDDDDFDGTSEDSQSRQSPSSEVQTRSSGEEPLKYLREPTGSSKKRGSSSDEEAGVEPDDVNKELCKKRKEAISADSDVPSKKVKPEECYDSESFKSELGETSNSIKDFKSEINRDVLIKSLASELQSIRNHILYHRLKELLFEVIHQAQEEQMKLDVSECNCNCVRCHSFAIQKIHFTVDSSQDTRDLAEYDNDTSPPAKDCVNNLNANGRSSSESNVPETNNINLNSESKMNNESEKRKQIESSEVISQNVCENNSNSFHIPPSDKDSEVHSPEQGDSDTS